MQKAITAKMAGLANEEAREINQLDVLDKIQIPRDILPEERTASVYNVIFKLVKKKRGRCYLDNCSDNVPNPKNGGRPERIWLLNGAHSIWDSELENILKDKNRYERSRKGRDIIFLDGVCRIKSTDMLALEFMRANAHNVGKRRSGAGPFDFYEYDPQEEQKERAAKQMLQIEMILKVKDMAEDKVKKLAAFFAIPFTDEVGSAKSPEGLRTELMIKAQSDPSTFQKYIDSKEVEISYLVKRAIIDNKIDLGGEARNVSWSQGKGFICKIPVNRKPYDYLTELAMTNSEDGRTFKEQLERMVQ